ncbi:hypothetical protein BJX76DRAFT_329570 [Aspergillus varians]
MSDFSRCPASAAQSAKAEGRRSGSFPGNIVMYAGHLADTQVSNFLRIANLFLK